MFIAITEITKSATTGAGMDRNKILVSSYSSCSHFIRLRRAFFSSLIKKASLVLFYIAKDFEIELRLAIAFYYYNKDIFKDKKKRTPLSSKEGFKGKLNYKSRISLSIIIWPYAMPSRTQSYVL